MKTFTLKYKEMQVGSVTDIDGDFPWITGSISYSSWVSNPGTLDEKRFVEFLNLSKDLNFLQDESENQQKIEEVESELFLKYQDILESDEWFVIDEENALQISPPAIHRDGEIAWRFTENSNL